MLADVEHRDDVAVDDALGGTRLAFEAPAHDLVAREVGLQELERDLFPVGSGGAVDAAHAAVAEHRTDLVGRYVRARRELRDVFRFVGDGGSLTPWGK